MNSLVRALMFFYSVVISVVSVVLLYTLLIIIVLTIAFVVIGWLILRHEFRPVTMITKDLYEMQQHKQPGRQS